MSQTTFVWSLEQVLGPQVGGLVVPEKESPNAGIVVGGVDWSIVSCGRVGINIALPVEQLAGTTICIEKLADCCDTEGKLVSEQVIVTIDVPAKSEG